jgi:hypothetical protein
MTVESRVGREEPPSSPYLPDPGEVRLIVGEKV